MQEKSMIEQMRQEARRIEKKAEYDAKRETVRKPRAVRKFERYSRMGSDTDREGGENGKKPT